MCRLAVASCAHPRYAAGILSGPACMTTDIASLETELTAAVQAAADEAALEAVRVAALGKKGSVSELLKGLGAMSAEERQVARCP